MLHLHGASFLYEDYFAHCLWASFLFFNFSLLFILNRALTDNSACSTDKVLPCVNISVVIILSLLADSVHLVPYGTIGVSYFT